VELVLSPVSGGGLLSGVATGIKLTAQAEGISAPQVWGCEPELAADAAESFRTKTLVEWPAEKTTRSLCDGLRTQSLGTLNFEHILRFVDGIVTISDEEMRSAAKVILAATKIVAEPSGAVTLAAALFHTEELPKARKVVAIVSGGNLEPALRAELEAE
jgi:threonine dehydratase